MQKRRTIRLAYICTFVIIFIGLPAFSQKIGNDNLNKFDLIKLIAKGIDKISIALEETRYQIYLNETNQISVEDDQTVILSEESEGKYPLLWELESMFKNVFGPMEE